MPHAEGGRRTLYWPDVTWAMVCYLRTVYKALACAVLQNHAVHKDQSWTVVIYSSARAIHQVSSHQSPTPVV